MFSSFLVDYRLCLLINFATLRFLNIVTFDSIQHPVQTERVIGKYKYYNQLSQILKVCSTLKYVASLINQVIADTEAAYSLLIPTKSSDLGYRSGIFTSYTHEIF